MYLVDMLRLPTLEVSRLSWRVLCAAMPSLEAAQVTYGRVLSHAAGTSRLASTLFGSGLKCDGVSHSRSLCRLFCERCGCGCGWGE